MKRLNISDHHFDTDFTALLVDRETTQTNVADVARDIIADVKVRGDDALIDYTSRFDGLDLTANTIRVDNKRINDIANTCDASVREALQLTADRLRSYHEKQLPKNELYTDETGTQLGWRWSAIDAVGIYVPGGRANYPSSVLHNAILARVAGVTRLCMVVPTPKGEVNPAVFAAAQIADINEIYTIGGAQAVAALAYGTQNVNAVDKIVGPGNAYVAEAKRQVFGKVGIDMIAGPSEILVIADNQNNPDWIAADLLSQAEHDPSSQSVLITDSTDFADAVTSAIEQTLRTLPREVIARESWENHGAIIVVENWKQAADLANQIASEHLELAIENPESMADSIRHAGAIFMGRHTPEAIGDYVAGPSHVLPTSHTARFSSGLSVYDFIKKTSIIGCTQRSIQAIGHQAATLADAEGLQAHALSVRCRLK